MNYAYITKSSFVNGDGCRAVLWLSGCTHHCLGCQNQELQDPGYGLEVTTGTLFELIKLLKKPHIDGLTLSGGDPMYPEHRKDLELILQFLKKEVPDKTIWMYTGYRLDEIKTEPVLKYVDVVVDGKYMQDREPALYRGSDNQRIWRKNGGTWKADAEN